MVCKIICGLAIFGSAVFIVIFLISAVRFRIDVWRTRKYCGVWRAKKMRDKNDIC